MLGRWGHALSSCLTIKQRAFKPQRSACSESSDRSPEFSGSERLRKDVHRVSRRETSVFHNGPSHHHRSHQAEPIHMALRPRPWHWKMRPRSLQRLGAKVKGLECWEIVVMLGTWLGKLLRDEVFVKLFLSESFERRFSCDNCDLPGEEGRVQEHEVAAFNSAC